MTLITSFYVADCPCLVSDCLVSRQAIAGAKVHTPLLGQVSANLHIDVSSSSHFPCYLAQKTLLCGPDLVFAWAGKLSTAQDILSDIYTKHSKNPFTLRTLKSHMERLPHSVGDEIGLIGHFNHSKTQCFNFDWGSDVTTIPSSRYRRIKTAGTGIKSVHALLGNIDSEEIVDPPTDSQQLRSARILGHVAGLTATLMAQELTNPDLNLGACFGGAYEVTIITPEGFKKLDDITYVFWSVELEPEPALKTPFFPTQALRISYQHDILVARPVFTIDSNGLLGDSKYIIPPINRELSNQEVSGTTKPNFDSRLTVHSVNLVRDNIPQDHFVFLESHTHDSKYLRFSESGPQTKISVSNAFFSMIEKTLRNRAESTAC